MYHSVNLEYELITVLDIKYIKDNLLVWSKQFNVKLIYNNTFFK